jgi:hypothetical protein
MEQINEDFFAIDKSAGNKRIWESLVAHCIIIDFKQGIDIELGVSDFSFTSIFSIILTSFTKSSQIKFAVVVITNTI